MESSILAYESDIPDFRSNSPTSGDSEEGKIIPDSDDDVFTDSSSDEVSGRITPSIHKAIRRSIFNLSRSLNHSALDCDDEENVESDDGDEDYEGTRRKRHILLSTPEDTTSDSEDEFIPTQKKRLNRILDSSDDATPTKFHHGISNRRRQKSSSFRINATSSSSPSAVMIDLTSKESEEDSDVSSPSIPQHNRTPGISTISNLSWRPDYIVASSSSDEEPDRSRRKSTRRGPGSPQYVDSSSDDSFGAPLRKVTPVDLESSSDSGAQGEEQDRSAGEAAALSFAQEELGLHNIDPLVAQRRALLAIELQKKQTEMTKIKAFIDSGKVELLPDKGKKFLNRASQTEAELREIRQQLSECRLVENNVTSPTSTTSSQPHYQLSPSPQVIKHVRRPRDPDYEPDSEADIPTSSVARQILTRPTTAPIGDLGKKALETFEREQALTVETLKSFHGSLNSRPGEEEQAEEPRGLKISLMPHQKHALAWMSWRENQHPPGGVLADDMGLGKTLSMISLVLRSLESMDGDADSYEGWRSKEKSSRPVGGTLVVCPASLIGQWEEEVKRRCKKGVMNVEVYHGNKRENIPKRLARNDLVITTFNLLSREHRCNGVLFRVTWKRVILDEGHVIRNHKSQVCEAVCALYAHKRWVLTGTPIHNKEMDLFSVLKFLQCAPFDDIRVWKRWVDNKNQAGHDRLATVMKTLMLRRTKEELMKNHSIDSLPEKFSEIVWVTLDPEERVVYEKVMLYSKTIFAQFLHQRAEKAQLFKLGAGYYDRHVQMNKNPFNKAQQKLLAQHADVKSHQILTLFLRLRQICCHPSLIDAMLDQEDIEETGLEDMGHERLTEGMRKMTITRGGDEDVPDGPAEVDDRVSEHLLTSDNPVFEKARESSKLRAVLSRLEEILKMGEKVIIVSQWTSVLNIIADNLHRIEGATFSSLTGAVMVKDRGAIVDSFNHDRDPMVLLLSLTAGGVGLNLVGANHLMLVDIHWNPQLESQAQDRIYRFGQKKNVFIYKFLCSDTIEEKIKSMQEDKLELAKNILRGGGKAKAAKLTMDDLRTIFGL
ncbi:transcription termination factor 2 [Diachasmimorpha longicaudata]|uniref:transcription termination factor 2 n=1 Tax=Diachasmimorpha longicaudata TaxID=58733 RepID=UPI0030B89CA6